MSAITLTSIRDTVIDFSYPYFMSGMGFFTKKPSSLTKIFAIFWPYDIYVWIGVAVTLPTFALVYWIFAKVQNTRLKKKFTLGKVISEICQILVNQGKYVEHLN